MKKIDSLEPEFKASVEKLISCVEGLTGRKWVVTAGRRTMEEQREIYAQGRTAPGKVVSNAPAGSSAHNYGLAADLAPLKEVGTEIDWNAPRDLWRAMADVAVDVGLVSGFYFKTIFDAPHVESADWKVQRDLWKAGKIKVA